CEAAREVFHVTGGIDQPVAFGMLDEVAVAAEGFARVEAAVRNAAGDSERELAHGLSDSGFAAGADGAGGTGDQGPQRGAGFIGRARLELHEGIVARVAERGGSELTAGVAIDAGGIDKEAARQVFGNRLCTIGHDSRRSYYWMRRLRLRLQTDASETFRQQGS